MISILKIILLAAHLACMNISAAGPLICIYLGGRDREQKPRSIELARSLAAWSAGLLLLGIVLGLSLGAISYAIGSRHLVHLLPLFEYKIRWGILELICSLVWMLLFWGWLRWKPPQTRAARFGHGLLAVLSATNLLYHFPPLLSVMVKASNGEIDIGEAVTPTIFRKLAFTPDVMAHSLHFCWASFALTGVFLFWLAKGRDDATRFEVFGARVALVASLLQIPTGMWLLVASPPSVQSTLLRGDVGTLLFMISLGCAFYLLQALAAVGLGEPTRKMVNRSTILMALTILLMCGTLQLARG